MDTKETTLKAKKNYVCDGREQLIYAFKVEEEDTYEITQQIEKCKGIKKGEVYINQKQIEDGKIQHWRSCKGCDEVIDNFDLYDFD